MLKFSYEFCVLSEN